MKRPKVGVVIRNQGYKEFLNKHRGSSNFPVVTLLATEVVKYLYLDLLSNVPTYLQEYVIEGLKNRLHETAAHLIEEGVHLVAGNSYEDFEFDGEPEDCEEASKELAMMVFVEHELINIITDAVYLIAPCMEAVEEEDVPVLEGKRSQKNVMVKALSAGTVVIL